MIEENLGSIYVMMFNTQGLENVDVVRDMNGKVNNRRGTCNIGITVWVIYIIYRYID